MIDLLMISEYSGMFLSGLMVTLVIALLSCLFGIFLGCIVGIYLARSKGPLSWFLQAYVAVIRGTPMLIQVAAMFYMLKFAGFSITAFWSAIVSISLNSGAYMSQIVLAGIKSVPAGQAHAAKVLGMSNYQTMRYIVLPQAIYSVVPAFGNELVTLVKDSSLASTIGVCELTKQAEIVMSQTFDVPSVYIVVGVSYLALTSIVSLIVSKLDAKWNAHVKY